MKDARVLQPLWCCICNHGSKCPGVRPIGICECARRIVSKAILFITKGDVQDAAGPLQLCEGQVAGIEAAVHFMRHISVGGHRSATAGRC